MEEMDKVPYRDATDGREITERATRRDAEGQAGEKMSERNMTGGWRKVPN